MMKRRVGIVGYGNLGKYLVECLLNSSDLELAFVWNRTADVLEEVDKQYVLKDLSTFANRKPDLIVEVAHPNISRDYGEAFLRLADYMVGSPTTLANKEIESKLRKAASEHGLYIPRGALWGGEDIQRMADQGSLQALKITMTKPPASFKLVGELKEKLDASQDRTVLYDGPVRQLCPLAPNNVNTMAAAAMAAPNLGFDGVQGSIVADPHVGEWHVVTVEVWGKGNIEKDRAFKVTTERRNPAPMGHVTGSATYASFLSSMLASKGKGPGVHLC